MVFWFPQKSNQRLCRNGHVYQENVSGVFQRTTNGLKEGRNEGSKRPLKPLALLSEEFSPWSCHGDGQLEESLRFVSQKQKVSLIFLQLQSQPNATSHLHGVNMKSALVRLQERCVCEAVFVPGTERKHVFLFALTSCWTPTVPLCVIEELFRKWKSDAGTSLVGACEPDCQLPKLLTFQPGDRKSGTADDVTDSEGPQRHPAGTHRLLHYSSSTPEPHRHGDGTLMLLLQAETSHW